MCIFICIYYYVNHFRYLETLLDACTWWIRLSIDDYFKIIFISDIVLVRADLRDFIVLCWVLIDICSKVMIRAWIVRRCMGWCDCRDCNSSILGSTWPYATAHSFVGRWTAFLCSHSLSKALQLSSKHPYIQKHWPLSPGERSEETWHIPRCSQLPDWLID